MRKIYSITGYWDGHQHMSVLVSWFGLLMKLRLVSQGKKIEIRKVL